MLKKISSILGLLILVSIGFKAEAQTIENTVNSESQPNQEQTLDNDQNNAAAINQTGIYNIGDSATYKIQGLGGRQVVCPRPSFILGAGYNSNDGINFGENSSYAVNFSFIVPLGGKLGKTCETMANTIARKTQYDLEIINARSCAELLNAGVNLNPEKFPTLFDVCEGISLATNNTNLSQNIVNFKLQKSPKLKNKPEQVSELDKLKPSDFSSLNNYLRAKQRRRKLLNRIS